MLKSLYGNGEETLIYAYQEFEQGSLSSTQQYRVNACSGLRLRLVLGNNFDIIDLLPLGHQVFVGRRQGEWIKVDLQGECNFMAQGKVTATTLNLRTTPNTGSSILASLSTGEVVDILITVTGGSYPVGSGTSNQWHNVRVNGQTGFVAAAFVQLIAPPGSLQGNIESALSGLIGFDCASKLNRSLIAKFVSDSKDFRYCLRYLSLKDKQNTSVDLSHQEAEDILASGLALSPVQRVRKAGWVPTSSLGITTGQNAANNAISIGFPPGINVWLDLEGVKAGTPASDVIDYCNNWFDEVKTKDYIPGIYVGAGAILTGNQLANLKFQHYWKSGSRVPNIPGQGYQLIQTIPNPPLGELRHGIHIDYDKTQTDSLGGQVIWLSR